MRRLFGIIAALLLAVPLAGAAPEPAGIGLEQEITVALDRADYQPKPLDDRTPLILRLEKVTPGPDGKFNYVFHYISFEPGSYKLADYLVRPDGTPAEGAAEVKIQASSILPPDHQGELSSFSARPFPWFGGYRMMLGSLAVLWLCGPPAFFWFTRKKKTDVVAEPVAPPLTYAERMRPLVEAAAAGQLTASGQAELERLMTGYWREKIAQPDQRMSETISALKSHPQAGSLLRALERWLHTPGGASRAEIDGLLEPYLAPAASVETEVPA